VSCRRPNFDPVGCKYSIVTLLRARIRGVAPESAPRRMGWTVAVDGGSAALCRASDVSPHAESFDSTIAGVDAPNGCPRSPRGPGAAGARSACGRRPQDPRVSPNDESYG